MTDEERRNRTPEEQEEITRLCDEEACIVMCDFLGEGELMLSEEFLEHTPLPAQITLLKDWINQLEDIVEDLEADDKEHFHYVDDGPRTIN